MNKVVMMQKSEVVSDTFNTGADYKAPLFGEVIQWVEKNVPFSVGLIALHLQVWSVTNLIIIHVFVFYNFRINSHSRKG